MKRITFYPVIFVCLLLLCCQKKSEKHSPSFKVSETKSHPLTTIAYDLLDAKKTDSAFKVFNQAKEYYLLKKDTLMLVNSLTNMAIIATEAGDSFDGQEYSLEALKYLNKTNKHHHPYLLSILNNLGIASYDLMKYNEAIDFYNQSLSLITDSSILNTTKNNIANAYRQKGAYLTAIKLYNEALSSHSSEKNRARTLTNLTKTRLLQNPNYNPVPNYLKALEIRKRIDDLWGQNSSYSHLADYYLSIKPDSALFYSVLMYNSALKLKNPDNELQALAKLAELEPTKRLAYFKRYRQLDDSLTQARNTAKNQFALIRYQTEKHKADKLRLEKDNELKRAQLGRRNNWLSLAIFAILATLVISIIIYRQRKRSMNEQAERQIRDSKLKTSKEIHDVVANGLYRIMSEVEYSSTIDKPKLIGQIEKLYNQSRQISHAVTAHPMDFLERLEELVQSFSNNETKIFTVGLEEQLNTALSVAIKEEVLLAVQELLVNMDKHSKASQVVLRFQIAQSGLEIFYRDNGIGIAENLKMGSGIRNTESRILALKGKLIFGNHEHGGLQTTIQIPLT